MLNGSRSVALEDLSADPWMEFSNEDEAAQWLRFAAPLVKRIFERADRLGPEFNRFRDRP